MHRAHATSIPFENLDPHCGLPVSLAPEDVQRKLGALTPGWYRFEQNLLLKPAEALGTRVDLLLARVRFDRAAWDGSPEVALILRVRSGESDWHADVGFGSCSLLDPLPFGPGTEHLESGRRFRVVNQGPEFALQASQTGGWVDLYGFVPHPVPFVDETSNSFMSTHPRSPFVSGLIVSSQADDGTHTVLSDWNRRTLTEQAPESATVTPVDWEAVPEMLASRFGLVGI